MIRLSNSSARHQYLERNPSYLNSHLVRVLVICVARIGILKVISHWKWGLRCDSILNIIISATQITNNLLSLFCYKTLSVRKHIIWRQQISFLCNKMFFGKSINILYQNVVLSKISQTVFPSWPDAPIIAIFKRAPFF